MRSVQRARGLLVWAFGAPASAAGSPCALMSARARAGQWAMALDDANACTQLRPTWPRGHACRGAALEGMNNLPEALAAFKRAQDLSPSNPELVR